MPTVTSIFDDNPWFGDLPAAEADALLKSAKRVRLSCGEILFHQGDISDQAAGAFFGVTNGLLKLSVLHPSGSEVILTILEPGNWFGEGSLLDPLPRGLTAFAMEDSELLGVSIAEFKALMQRGAFARAIARLAAERLRLAYGLIADSALQSTRERIGRRLALLAHGDLTQSESSRCFVSVSQDNLAMMLGVSRPTLNKELQNLAEMGAISLRYAQIEIKDIKLLMANTNII